MVIVAYKLAEKLTIPAVWLGAGWLGGKELIIRLTQTSWAGAGTELGKKKGFTNAKLLPRT